MNLMGERPGVKYFVTLALEAVFFNLIQVAKPLKHYLSFGGTLTHFQEICGIRWKTLLCSVKCDK